MPLLHIVNWNVNGIRSIMKKDFVKDIGLLNPDILCVQETKANDDEVKDLMAQFPEYKTYINSSKARKGYSGTAILSKTAPLAVNFDMNIAEHDQEGRVITAEFESFFLITVYAPNSGEGLRRLDYRAKWDEDFRIYIENLSKLKPLVLCGDLNVAHTEMDIARAKENYNKSAGYTQIEIDGFNELLNLGFIDTFRRLHPNEVKYTYWNQLFNARARNRGWRIDYFLVSNALFPRVREASIYDEIFGSDHCPVAIKIEI